jgi:mannose-1-phosphate guanylyltransferase
VTTKMITKSELAAALLEEMFDSWTPRHAKRLAAAIFAALPSGADSLDVAMIEETDGCLLLECDHEWRTECVEAFHARLNSPVEEGS